jgi:hypothetical protein
MLKANKDFLRSLLEDGALMQGGYLDARKVRACLSADSPTLVVDASHLSKCLAAEIWLRKWSGGGDEADQSSFAPEAASH